MPDTQDYKHKLTICNTYFFSTATMVVRARPIGIFTYIVCLVTGLFELLRLNVILYKVVTYDVTTFCPPFSGTEV